MTAVLEATGLGKRYRRTWALRDCTVAIPAGRVVALVGPTAPARPPCSSWRSGS
jgi:ABC-2 type transport system ATP-binding protein